MSAVAVADLLEEVRLARAYSEHLIDALDPDQVAWRPRPESSAIAWHLGHQAAVAHYLVRNLTAAEPSLDPALDRVFDSATPEPERGDLPPLTEVLDFRRRVADSIDATIRRIIAGDVGAPDQLSLIAATMLRAIANHEYQHAQWISEVRAGFTDVDAPPPGSRRLTTVEGYYVVAV